ncbi:diaminopimelate epimerase [Methylomonas denitrificans]|uniref:Diaminopimelate epimerase n=1 Tax=Methylomonas denitrificans TaxID=1538553 RepID=A0A126T5E2_9GAMM|nr:diaminopimelate epimerase [Methylomonas denitrificans]OAI03134.1 diaminopimelate epimerase [Methylomonas methanica]
MINFTKMQGLGNDFVVIDAINQQIQLTTAQIRFLADRHFGVGCDQLLLVERPISDNAEFKYRIFNADGSEVAQCGNGARCFARFVRDKGLSKKDEIIVDTDARQLTLRFAAGDLVTVEMGVPALEPKQIPLNVSEQSKLYKVKLAETEVEFAAVSMGNPHAVIRVDDVANAPVLSIGARLECHELFPERANIGFMQIVNRRQIKLRVYERGAAETLACGSGACAAVVAGIEQGLLDQDVQVQLPGGELIISWIGSGHPVLMTGAATTVFEGQIKL